MNNEWDFLFMWAVAQLQNNETPVIVFRDATRVPGSDPIWCECNSCQLPKTARATVKN